MEKKNEIFHLIVHSQMATMAGIGLLKPGTKIFFLVSMWIQGPKDFGCSVVLSQAFSRKNVVSTWVQGAKWEVEQVGLEWVPYGVVVPHTSSGIALACYAMPLLTLHPLLVYRVST